MKLNRMLWMIPFLLVACQSGEPSMPQGTDSDSGDAGDEGPTDSAEMGDSDTVGRDSESEAQSWDDAGMVCYSADCGDDACRGFGPEECPDCPELADVIGGELPSDLDTYTESYICYYAPACGGAACSLYVNDAGDSVWSCAVRPC